MTNRLAVIGFDAQFSGLENIDRVAAAFYQGCDNSKELNWDDELLSFQFCVDRVLQVNDLSTQQIAVIVITDKETCNVMQGNFQRTCTVNSFADALTLTTKIVDEHDIPVLIIAANATESSTKQPLATISFDKQFSYYQQTAGIACVLLTSNHFATSTNRYIYSYLQSFCVSDDHREMENVIEQSFSAGGLSSDQISSIEVSALADQGFQFIEQEALLNSYNNNLSHHTSISCIKSVIGDCGSVSELSGFLNVILSLQQRYFSAIKDWITPQDNQLSAWLGSPFYLLNDSVPAFPISDGSPRRVAYSCLSSDQYMHLIIEENNDKQVHPNGFNAHCDLSLFILKGNSKADFFQQLSDLNSKVDHSNFKSLTKDYYQEYLQNSARRFCLVLVADSVSQLNKEISLALSGLDNAFANNRDWKTPQGSYCCVNPSEDPNTCFLYPGIGATYLGLGRDLLQLFPEIYPTLCELFNSHDASLKYQLLYPRSVSRLSFAERKKCDLALRGTLSDIAECGVGFACLYTRVFNDLFTIKADFASGYSMGEVSMFAALNCWQKPGQMSARLANSATFTDQLSGELNTLRELWQLPSIENGGEKYLWESYNIKGNVAEVESAIKQEDKVYITLINTDDSLVIAGYPADCLKVAERLGVRAIALNVHNAIHCQPAYQQYQEMIDLYSMDLADRISSKLYSSSCYLPVPFNRKAIAVSIAKCLCEKVDFPRLINTLVDQGVNAFIEMGAGRSLTSWTDKILMQRGRTADSLTVAVNASGSDPQLMMMRAIAKLLSLGVKMDLSRYFYGSIIVNHCQQKN